MKLFLAPTAAFAAGSFLLPFRSVVAVVAGFILLLGGGPTAAQETCALPIGINLAGPADYGSEWPFVNLMKYSRPWFTQNSAWVEGGANLWNTEYIDQIPRDQDGYPLALPFSVAGAETTQMVMTVFANTFGLPDGDYVVLYDGQGDLNVWGDAEILSEVPGRLEFHLTAVDNLIGLEIRASQAGDHLRNLRVLLPGTEATHETMPWSQAWLDKLAPFSTLRFMDWGLTNDSLEEQWSDRPHVDDYTYAEEGRGIPYEWMIEICNLKQADAWVCVPHRADDNYIREMARLFRDNLDPGLKVTVEYSNEIWNWMFAQANYLELNGDQNVDWPERIVPFIQNVMDIWTVEFAGQLDRLVRVVGVQGGWQDVSNRIVFNLTPGSFDAFSPAAYFGFSDAGYAALEALGAATTAEDVLFWAREGMEGISLSYLSGQKQAIADVLHIPMIYYEGGQHLTPQVLGAVHPYNQALKDAQTHPGMFALYNDWLASLRTLVDPALGGSFMHYAFISPKSGRFGSWGALEHQFNQNSPYELSAPKYQALLDALCDGVPTAVPGDEGTTPTIRSLAAAPNPFNAATTIRFALPEPSFAELTIYDMAGHRLTTLLARELAAGWHEVPWRPRDKASGVYFYRLKAGGQTRVQRCLMLK